MNSLVNTQNNLADTLNVGLKSYGLLKDQEEYSGYELEFKNDDVSIVCEIDYTIDFDTKDENTNHGSSWVTIHSIKNVTLCVDDYEIDLTESDKNTIRVIIEKEVA